MIDLPLLESKLAAGADLTALEAAAAARAMASVEVAAGAKETFLVALARKGETAAEVAAFALTFRELARNPGVERWAPDAIDIVGTGGDFAGTFNISTTVLFILATAGVPVLKHGNRSATSACGSADLLEALGVPLEAPPEQLRRSLDELGFAFFFAPAYHPAYKEVGPVRKALAARGQRTIFNILGPLINPGRPAHQLLGVYGAAWVPPLAAALDTLGLRGGLVVHGRIDAARGLDELSTATDNHVVGFGRLRDVDARWTPEQFGFARAPLADLAGGGVADNVRIFHDVLDAKARPGLLDTLAFNAGAALWAAGRTGTLQEGAALARDLLRSGAVKKRLAAVKEFYRPA